MLTITAGFLLTVLDYREILFLPWDKNWHCPGPHHNHIPGRTFPITSPAKPTLCYLTTLFYPRHVCKILPKPEKRWPSLVIHWCFFQQLPNYSLLKRGVDTRSTILNLNRLVFPTDYNSNGRDLHFIEKFCQILLCKLVVISHLMLTTTLSFSLLAQNTIIAEPLPVQPLWIGLLVPSWAVLP